MEIKPIRQRTYIITGMGKSGTTFLSRALQKMGVNMGKRMYGSSHENEDFVDIDNDVLVEAGGRPTIGAVPPSKENVEALKEKYAPRYRQAIEKSMSLFWGVKQPRFSITFPIVMPEILAKDDDPYIYISVRKPEHIAKSVGRDDPVGREVAREYYRRVFAYLSEYLGL